MGGQSGFLVQGLWAYMEGAADNSSPIQRQVIGQLNDPSLVSDHEFVESFKKVASRPFCLLMFHPSIHLEFSKFVEVGGPDVAGGRDIVFLFLSGSSLPGVSPLDGSISCDAPELKDGTFPLFSFVEEELGLEISKVGYPGFLIFQGLNDLGRFMYVPAPSDASLGQLETYCRKLWRLVLADGLITSVDWEAKLGDRLATAGFRYKRSGELSVKEKIFALLRILWAAKSDIGVLISLI